MTFYIHVVETFGHEMNYYHYPQEDMIAMVNTWLLRGGYQSITVTLEEE